MNSNRSTDSHLLIPKSDTKNILYTDLTYELLTSNCAKHLLNETASSPKNMSTNSVLESIIKPPFYLISRPLGLSKQWTRTRRYRDGFHELFVLRGDWNEHQGGNKILTVTVLSEIALSPNYKWVWCCCWSGINYSPVVWYCLTKPVFWLLGCRWSQNILMFSSVVFLMYIRSITHPHKILPWSRDSDAHTSKRLCGLRDIPEGGVRSMQVRGARANTRHVEKRETRSIQRAQQWF